MQKELLIERVAGQTRLALVEDGDLAELYIERKGCEKLVGSIYLGRVANVLPGMQAAFVDIGLPKNGFFYAGDIPAGIDPDEALVSAQASIAKRLKVGQEVLVQVVKEPGGAKGPRLTGNITLPGRVAVLLPTVNFIGISHRIEDEAERARLHALAESLKPDNMGLIIRTAGEGVDAPAIESDVQYLTKLWSEIKRRAEHAIAPKPLYQDLSLIHRSVRDMLLPDVSRLLIEDRAAYETARENAAMLGEALAEKVCLYEDETPLFDRYRIDTLMEKALSRRVWLKSGGYLIFDYAEALTVIDVNTGKFVGKHSLADTVYKINCEAVVEIAKQLRLRDIGGIIVIDFIDMENQEHRDGLVALLRKELKQDRTKTNLVGLTGLGLVEMTRKKVHQPLPKLLLQPCPNCQGSGMVASDEALAYAALRALSVRVRDGRGAYLIDIQPGAAGRMMLIGAPEDLHAYVHPNPDREAGTFEITPVLEHELPPKTRPLPPRGDQ